MKRPRESPVHGHPPRLASVVERNIDALVARRRSDEERQGLQERTAAAITRFAGSLAFVYLHLLLFGLWILINLGILPIVEPFDPTLVTLAMAASVEAIFLSTFVLITQNRMAALAEKRAELDLQISLLAEHEITRLIRLTTAMARQMGIDEGENPELNELAQDVAPERVMDHMESSERESASADHDPGPRREDGPL